MAVIEKLIKLKGSIGEKDIAAIFDSGSTYSCIQPELAKKLARAEPLPGPKDFDTVHRMLRTEKKRKVTAKERVSLDFDLNGYTFSDEFMIIPELSDPVIIGAATLQKWRMKLNFETDEVIIDPRVTKLRLLMLTTRDHWAPGLLIN